VFWAAFFAAFLDSRFRGNDASALLSVKNLPLKGDRDRVTVASGVRVRRTASGQQAVLIVIGCRRAQPGAGEAVGVLVVSVGGGGDAILLDFGESPAGS
jgi:hypothetical protein